MTNAGTLELIELESLMKAEVGCQNLSHSSGWWGHVPNEGAAWLITAPCGKSVQMCNGGTRYLETWGSTGCRTGCGGEHQWEDLAVRPI